MYNFNIPDEKRSRVIINTDAKNEVDDQFAIVQALLTQSFEIHGIIAAHFGDKKSVQSQKDSYDEVIHVLKKMGVDGSVKVVNGAECAIPNEMTPVESEGAELIIEEALRDDDRPLYITFLGPLTDMASALIMEPEIIKKDIRVIWIGGGDWPEGGWEYNLSNDVNAANVILKSKLDLWQVPRNVYRMMPVSFAELISRVYPYGEIGKYLAENVIKFNNEALKRPSEYRILGDSPAIGLMMYSDCGKWSLRPAPELDENMRYIHNGKNRPIKVYESIDSRFILEDLYSKLAQFNMGKEEDIKI